jgi:transposase
MAASIRWVGLDVHARQSTLALFEQETGELSSRRVLGGARAVIEVLAELGPGVRAVYEAGPTGFVLARAAAERGLCVRVCAPGSIARKPSDRVKTDRRDAERLARLLAVGDLAFVRVPPVEEEQLRDLVRAREDVRGDLMRARHRLSKFLLRRELRYPGDAGAWTQLHLAWLAQLEFADSASRVAFRDYLSAVEALLQRRTALERALAELIPSSPWAETVARLRCFRGIDALSACGLCAEVGDFGRFQHPSLLASYLGLVPSEWTSDQSRRQGAITKAGSRHARRLLVEAAHHYRHPPRVSAALRQRQRGQDPRVCAVAWRAQRRLHQRWQRLHRERGKPAGVVVVACARELATFCWEAAASR